MQLELAFFAPIPVGHEVVIQAVEVATFFNAWELTHPLVLDRATGIVWTRSEEGILVTMQTFETAALGPKLRRKGSPIVAEVVGCQVRTIAAAPHDVVVTSLLLAAIDRGIYR